MNTQEKIEQRRQEAAKAQKINKKRSESAINDKFWKKLLGIVIAVVLVAGIFLLIFFQSGLSRRMITAFKVGDEKVSVAEYSYYYSQTYSNYYQTMVDYVGEENVPIDKNVSLKKQYMSEGVTYADYFSSGAMNTLQNLIAVSKKAEAEGFELPAEYQESYDTTLDNIDQYAKLYNISTAKYLNTYFGMGFNQKLLKKCIYREMLVAAYEEKIQSEIVCDDEALNGYYEEHKTDFDTADIRIVQFAAKEANEEAGTEEVTSLQAKADAEEFLAKCTSAEAYAEAALEKAKNEAEDPETATDSSHITNLIYGDANALNPKVAEYIFNDERQAGDCDIVSNVAETVFYVIYIDHPAERDERNTVNVRHILLQFDVTDEEVKASKENEINAIYDQFVAGGGTEEVFAELAGEFSQDSSYANGGLYENVKPGQTVAEFNDWCFDPARQVGDTDIVLTQYGYHLMYLSGFGDPAWKVDAEAALKEGEMDAWAESLLEGNDVTINPSGIALRDEPVA